MNMNNPDYSELLKKIKEKVSKVESEVKTERLLKILGVEKPVKRITVNLPRTEYTEVIEEAVEEMQIKTGASKDEIIEWFLIEGFKSLDETKLKEIMENCKEQE